MYGVATGRYVIGDISHPPYNRIFKQDAIRVAGRRGGTPVSHTPVVLLAVLSYEKTDYTIFVFKLMLFKNWLLRINLLFIEWSNLISVYATEIIDYQSPLKNVKCFRMHASYFLLL